MPIVEISDIRHYPRLGRVRLGIKKEGQRGPYPAATDYFVCPEEVEAVHGPHPTELPVMFPADDLELVAPQWYKCYSYSQGLVCKGNGKTCRRKVDTGTGDFAGKDTEKWEMGDSICDPHQCPKLEAKQCRKMMSLLFILPEVPGLGVYQLDTSSFFSFVNINSQLAAGDPVRNVPEGFLRQFTRGRISFMPLILSIGPQVVTPPGEGRKTVHVLSVRADVKLADLIRISSQGPRQVLLPALQEEEPPDDLYPKGVIGGEGDEAKESASETGAPVSGTPTPDAAAERYFTPPAEAEQMENETPGLITPEEKETSPASLKTPGLITGGVSRGGFGALFDTQKGNDKTGDGSPAKPFKTKKRAQAEVDRRSGEAGPAAGAEERREELPYKWGNPSHPVDDNCNCPKPVPANEVVEVKSVCLHRPCGGYLCIPPIDCYPGCPHMPLGVDYLGGGEAAPPQGGDRDAETTTPAEPTEVKKLQLGEAVVGEASLSSPVESQKSAERAPGAEPPPELGEVGEGVAIDLQELTQTMKRINWTEDTAKTWLASQFKVSPLGKLTEVLALLTREQADKFVKELQDRAARAQPGLFD